MSSTGWRLELLKEDRVVAVHRLEARPIRIGRALENDLVVTHPRVSAWHALVQPGADGLQVVDLQSSNGTEVNGDEIRQATAVHDGDTIELGGHVMLRVRHVVPPGDAAPGLALLEDRSAGTRWAFRGSQLVLGSGSDADIYIGGAIELRATVRLGEGDSLVVEEGGLSRMLRRGEVFEIGGHELVVPRESAEVARPRQTELSVPPYAATATLDGATGPEVTLVDVRDGRRHTVTSPVRATFLYLLVREAVRDRADNTAAAESGWLDNDRLRRELWGAARHGQLRNNLQVLVHRARKELNEAGFDGWCVEKKRGFTRLNVRSVEIDEGDSPEAGSKNSSTRVPSLRVVLCAGRWGWPGDQALGEGSTPVGRVPHAASGLALPDDAGLADTHLVFESEGDGLRVRGLDAEMRLNGQLCSHARLADGDVIRASDTVLVVRFRDAALKDAWVPELVGDAPAMRACRRQLVGAASGGAVVLRLSEVQDVDPVVAAIHRLRAGGGACVELDGGGLGVETLMEALEGSDSVVVDGVEQLADDVMAWVVRAVRQSEAPGLIAVQRSGDDAVGALRAACAPRVVTVPRLARRQEDVITRLFSLERPPPPGVDAELVERVLGDAWADGDQALLRIVDAVGRDDQALVAALRARYGLSAGEAAVPDASALRVLFAELGSVDAVAARLGRSSEMVARWVDRYGLDEAVDG